MPETKAIPFGGVLSREHDHLVPVEAALHAKDCFLDDDTISGRNGYTGTTGSTLTSGKAQGVWRFNPNKARGRTAAVANGHIYLIRDPSSDTATDAQPYDMGAVFGSLANVSATQLGTNLYLASDDTTAMQRITEDYSLEAVTEIAKPTIPTWAHTALGWTYYRSASAAVAVTDCQVYTTGPTGMDGYTTWYWVGGSGYWDDNQATGSYITMTLTTAEVWTGADWALFAMGTPWSNDTPGTELVVSIASTANPSDWTEIGRMTSIPEYQYPTLRFFDLRTINTSALADVKYIKIQLNLYSTNGGRSNWIVMGHQLLYGRTTVATNPRSYYVDFYDPTTQQQSELSDELEVRITSSMATPASYVTLFINSGEALYDDGLQSPFNATNISADGGNHGTFNYNAAKPIAGPEADEVGPKIVVSGTAPTYTGTRTARLWLDTSNGRRLVGSQLAVASGAAYSITDTGTVETLQNDLYKGGGALSTTTFLTSHAGRLVGGYLNRVYISSFTPTDDDTNPAPQFPDIAVETADGWSFDIAPGTDEQLIGGDGSGDAVYLLTNKAVYSMSDIAPDSSVFKVFQRGCVSRRGYVYAEDRLFWCSWDGVWMAVNRSNVSELSLPIRRMYRNTFLPDKTVVIAYDLVTRSLLLTRGTCQLRYSFAASEGREWTGPHTLAHAFNDAVAWMVPE